MSCFNLLGHRGAKSEVLENSEEGFLHAQSLIDKGLDGIEFDVQLTKDHQLLLAHDNVLDRVCNQQGRIEKLSVDYCKRVYKHANQHTMLILPDVEPYLDGYKHIELELKTHERMDKHKLVDSLEKTFFSTNLQNLPIVLTSFDVQILEILQHHPKFKHVPRGLIVQDPFNNADMLNTVLRLQACSLGLRHDLITPEMVTLCHQYGIKISAWTVNELALAKRLIHMNVDTVITDQPSRFLKNKSWLSAIEKKSK